MVAWGWDLGGGQILQGTVHIMKEKFFFFFGIVGRHWMVWNRKMTQSDLYFKEYLNRSHSEWLIQQMFMEDTDSAMYAAGGGTYLGDSVSSCRDHRNFLKTFRQEKSFCWHLWFTTTTSKLLVTNGMCILKQWPPHFQFLFIKIAFLLALFHGPCLILW